MTDIVPPWVQRFSQQALADGLAAQPKSNEAHWLMMQCVVASANLRIHEKLWGRPEYDRLIGSSKPCPYWTVQRYGLTASRQLGRRLRKELSEPSESAFWPLLERVYQDNITDCRQRWRRVHLSRPSFTEICEVIRRQNTLITDVATFVPGGSAEADDDYGCLVYHRRWRVFLPDGIKHCHKDLFATANLFFELVHYRSPSPAEYREAEDAGNFVSCWTQHWAEPPEAWKYYLGEDSDGYWPSYAD